MMAVSSWDSLLTRHMHGKRPRDTLDSPPASTLPPIVSYTCSENKCVSFDMLKVLHRQLQLHKPSSGFASFQACLLLLEANQENVLDSPGPRPVARMQSAAPSGHCQPRPWSSRQDYEYHSQHQEAQNFFCYPIGYMRSVLIIYKQGFCLEYYLLLAFHILSCPSRCQFIVPMVTSCFTAICYSSDRCQSDGNGGHLLLLARALTSYMPLMHLVIYAPPAS